MNLLVTGFGPFGDIADNPSSVLAESCGGPYELLEVAYAGVDAWLEGLDPDRFEGLLLMGVSAGSERMRLETTARNWIGKSPDVRGEVWGPMPIDPLAPPQLAATLWQGEALLGASEDWDATTDAGDYLCNYVFFRALQRFPDRLVGFLHVPPFEVMDADRQKAALQRILGALETAPNASRARFLNV